ncbi:MAG: DUF58 domain-containing protein [Acidobacteriota bacterium]
MSADASAPSGGPAHGSDVRAEIGAARRGQLFTWGLTAAALLALLSVFSGGLFLYAVAVVGLLLAGSTLLTTLSIRGLEISRRLSDAEIVCGDRVDVWLTVHNAKELPASGLFWRDQIEPGLDVEGPTCCATSLSADEKRGLAYRLHSTRRGLYRIGPAMVEASGPFGLVRRFLLHSEAKFVTVLPRSVEIGRGWPLGHRPIHEVPRRRSLFEDPSRFQGIREYQRGDSLRRVHWRATARSGKLQVKLFEPAVLEGVTLAVEMAQKVLRGSRSIRESSRDDEPNALEELAATAAASIAEFVIAGGQAAGLLSNGADAAERYPEDWSGETFRRFEDALEASSTRRKVTGFRPLEATPAKGAWQLAQLRQMLARLVPAPGPSLPELLLAELPRLSRQLVLMIVTPRLDEALVHAVQVLERSGIEVGVVWVGAGDESQAVALDETPVYAVRDETDLEALGGHRL